jgi:predicted PurR-regulated permease PerM
VDGQLIKSINQWFNNRNTQLQYIKDTLLIKGITNQQVKLTAKHNNQVRDYLNKTARFMVNHCIQNSIANFDCWLQSWYQTRNQYWWMQ